jgi:hypothetical protein
MLPPAVFKTLDEALWARLSWAKRSVKSRSVDFSMGYGCVMASRGAECPLKQKLMQNEVVF